jgi:hypothetical protein
VFEITMSISEELGEICILVVKNLGIIGITF